MDNTKNQGAKEVAAINAAIFAAEICIKVVSSLTTLRDEKRRGGKPSYLQSFLYGGVHNAKRCVPKVFGSVFQSFINGSGLVSTADKLVLALQETCQFDCGTKKERISLGVQLIDFVGVASGAFEIVAEQSDRPSKQDDGVKVTLSYSIKPIGNLMESLVAAGKCDMPSPVVGGDRARHAVKEKGRDNLIHAELARVKGVTPDSAVGLFNVANTMLGYRYAINHFGVHMVKLHDREKVKAHFHAKFIAKGMDENNARKKAAEISLL